MKTQRGPQSPELQQKVDVSWGGKLPAGRPELSLRHSIVRVYLPVDVNRLPFVMGHCLFAGDDNVYLMMDAQGGFVPGLAVFFGVMLAIGCIGVLFFFIHHIASSIQAYNIIDSVAQETIAAKKIGYIESVQKDALLRVAGMRESLGTEPSLCEREGHAN